MSEKTPRPPQPETGEKRENEPSPISLYVEEYEVTEEGRTVIRNRDDGKGTYEARFYDKLDEPRPEKIYAWEGQLWKQEKKDQYRLGNPSYKAENNIKELAENLALNLQSNANPTLPRPYKINHFPTPEIIQRLNEKHRNTVNIQKYQVRSLTFKELEAFQTEIKKALEGKK
jgi:hypothetical protein